MGKKCKNCKHFGGFSAEYAWGDCVKPGEDSLDSQGTKTLGVFTWADKSCDDFEPIVDQPVQDFL